MSRTYSTSDQSGVQPVPAGPDPNNDDYYLYQDQSLHSALVIEKRSELLTIDHALDETLEGEWERTFRTPMFQSRLKEAALLGQLNSTNFRSVVWQLFLGVLPGDLNRWLFIMECNRERYDELKAMYVVDPHQRDIDMSLTVNNPLSQEEKSPWNQFFMDNELRKVIQQDLHRTYPGELMFEQPEIQELMLNILFIYAREHPDIMYKQGMHELLAALVYVFYTDYHLVQDVVTPHTHETHSVLSIEHLEHDLYWCYIALMSKTRPYFATDTVAKGTPKTESEIQQLFKPEPNRPSTFIVHTLEELQSVTLKRFDQELQQHLQKFDIQPQLYGLKWMRLLFGREFSLKNLLILWDSLFASPDFQGMVEFVCIAMLLFVRDSLLCSDYTGCLSLLLRYPETQHVNFFISKALFLRNPGRYPCPPNLQYRPRRTTLPPTARLDRKTRLNSSTIHRSDSVHSRTGSVASARVIPSSRRSSASSTRVDVGQTRSAPELTPDGKTSKGFEITEDRRVVQYCGKRLDSIIDELQGTAGQICEADTEQEDRLLLAVAALKQVRDVLKGNVSLGCVLDSEIPSSVASSINGTDEQREEEEEDFSECPGSEPQRDSLCPVAPVISQADMETLNLFQDIAAEPSSGTFRRQQQQATGQEKQKDFNDPLSSLLSEVEESLPDFLRK